MDQQAARPKPTDVRGWRVRVSVRSEVGAAPHEQLAIVPIAVARPIKGRWPVITATRGQGPDRLLHVQTQATAAAADEPKSSHFMLPRCFPVPRSLR